MSDLISRENAIREARPEYLNPQQEKLASYNQGWNDAIDEYMSGIKALLSASKTEPQTETPYACGKCPYHEQCSAEDWRSCRYNYVSGRYIDPQEREGK